MISTTTALRSMLIYKLTDSLDPPVLLSPSINMRTDSLVKARYRIQKVFCLTSIDSAWVPLSMLCKTDWQRNSLKNLIADCFAIRYIDMF